MSAFDVIDLSDGDVVDLGTHLSGAWGSTRVLELATGASRSFGEDATETCMFLIDGTAEISLDGGVRTVSSNTGVTLIRGARTTLTATEPVRLFVAEVTA